MRRRLGELATWIGIASALGACTVSGQRTGLPDYAKPALEIVSPDDQELGDLLTYRTLSRADFRSQSPRADLARHANEIGAFTCVTLPPQVERDIQVVRDGAAGVYVARAVDFDYFALMDPHCSWWNPSAPPVPVQYLLQHEQIHFALYEIEARKVLAKVREMESRASSRSEAILGLQQEIDSALRSAIATVLEINTRFDLDTSGKVAPRRQAEWWTRVEAELLRLPAGGSLAVDEDRALPSDSAEQPL